MTKPAHSKPLSVTPQVEVPASDTAHVRCDGERVQVLATRIYKGGRIILVCMDAKGKMRYLRPEDIQVG